MSPDTPLLSVRNLSVYYPQKSGLFGIDKKRVLENVSLDLFARQIVALVGESGSGKSTVGYAITGLIDDFKGEFLFQGIPYDPRKMEKLRQRIQIIFQDSLSALNPRLTVNQAITEILSYYNTGGNSVKTINHLFDRVKLPKMIGTKYPFELSGGQRQRVCIARALAVNPNVLICDEIVSSLDVSVQAKILNLLSELVIDHGLALLFTTHDLNIVYNFSDQVIILHKGQIAESNRVRKIFQDPSHEYTKQLLSSFQS